MEEVVKSEIDNFQIKLKANEGMKQLPACGWDTLIVQVAKGPSTLCMALREPASPV